MTPSGNATPNWFAGRPTLRTGLFAAAMTLVIGYAGAQLQDPAPRPSRRQAGNNALRMTFIMGKVTGGDPAAGTIVISLGDDKSQTIKADQDTKFVTMSAIRLSALRVGDEIQVEGVPTNITANAINVGELPDVITGRPGLRRIRSAATNGEAGNADLNGADPNAPAQAPKTPLEATASANGKITSKNPLTVALSDEVSVVLKVSDTTRVTKIVPATINSIKLGDSLVASGQTWLNGTFAAAGVGININSVGSGAYGGGRLGFGGPGGQAAGFGAGRRAGRGPAGQGANGGGDNP